MTSSFPAYQKQAFTCENMSVALSQQLGADICLIGAVGSKNNILEILCGFQLSNKHQWGPFVIDLTNLPRLSSAIGKGRSLRIAGATLHPDLDNLGIALGDISVSSALAAILPKSAKGRLWVALLLRMSGSWLPEDQEELEQSLIKMDLLAWQEGEPEKSNQGSSFIETPPAVYEELEELEIENQRYRNDIERLISYIDQLKDDQGEQDSESNGPLSSQESVTGISRESKTLRQDLLSAYESSSKQPQRPSEEALQAKEELRLALEELARLQARLTDSATSINDKDVEKKSNAKLPAKSAERIADMAQDLRQPLSSVQIYSELLLGESIGILGALQRSFLERVQLSSKKMNQIIEDLIDVALRDSSEVNIERKPVDLASVIDDVINLSKDQLLAKRSILRVDLPRLLPKFETDQDALEQILFHLLQNANSVTPAEGEVTLRAAVDAERELGDFVLIEISDSGGGIPPKNLSQIFARVYRDENPVIEGIGETGVGLTLAESLTKALGGRIWVDSEYGKGATFSVLLPLVENGTAAKRLPSKMA
jgi:signal transduction histidine kinase